MAEGTMTNIEIRDFTEVRGVNDTDFVVLSLSDGISARMAVGIFRASVAAGITPSIKDGIWWIGDSSTSVVAEGKTPEFRQGSLGIEWKYTYEPDTAWRLLVAIEDILFTFNELTPEQRDMIKLKFSDLTQDEIAELQQPANDTIEVLEKTNENVRSAEDARVAAENKRISAEEARANAESERISSEQKRKEAELLRKDDYLVIRKNAEEATSDAILAAEQARNTPIIQNGTWWLYDIEKEEYVDTGQSVNANYELTKEKIESVFVGDIETHTHTHLIYCAQKYEEVPDFSTLTEWKDDKGELHAFVPGNDIYVIDRNEPTGYANYKLAYTSSGNEWVRIPQVVEGFKMVLDKDL